jgi:hypothetical protein
MQAQQDAAYARQLQAQEAHAVGIPIGGPPGVPAGAPVAGTMAMIPPQSPIGSVLLAIVQLARSVKLFAMIDVRGPL